jgi:hypothetical protein
LAILADLKESIANHERQLHSLRSRISGLEPNPRADVKALKSGSPDPVPPVSHSKSLNAVECPFKKGFFSPVVQRKGIISYLTQKHGGNVHDKGIVTITSKSVWSDYDAVRNAADLDSNSRFKSKDEPGEWICWDFHEMRIRLTHYTIESSRLKSWVIESSLDGEAWTEIDRRTTNVDLRASPNRESFDFLNSGECRFIRLTQTGRNHIGDDNLEIRALEFFGTLLE